MKRIALILFLFPFLWSASMQAQCSQDYISLFPKGETIEANGLIVIEANGMAQKVVNELTFLHPIYLQSSSHKVYLTLKESRTGQVDQTQVLLLPESALIAGEDYELKVDGLEADEKRFFQREDEQGNSFFISWTVSSEEYNEPPVWKGLPKFGMLMHDKQGECERTVYATFGVEIEAPYEVLIKTEVFDIIANTNSVYYLQANERGLWVGCEHRGGAFDLVENHNYKVRFDVLDAVGNATGDWTDWVSFQVPEYKQKVTRIPRWNCLPDDYPELLE
ncbi:MAG: hypothetical protein AB8B69_17595 [Chitinophagales bacterium]